jgi:phosphate binding protein
VLGEDDTKLQASGAQFSENDNVLVQGVTGSPYAIGYFGYAYYAENTGTLKAISVDGVEPSQENVDNGTYPLARPLFVYSDAAIMEEKPQVAAFINFYLSFVNDEVVDVGYFPAPAADLDTAKNSWLTAMGMPAMSGGSSSSGGAASSGAGVELPEVDPAAVEGNIITAGSSTVFPLTQRMAERFNDEGFAGEITIDSIGTGGGFERFCVAGETDIANASRPIEQDEIDACAALSPARTPIEFRVGTDALAVVVSAENDFVTELTLEQLGQIFNGDAKAWNEVDPSFPAEAIQLFSPGSDSGTYDYFVEEVLGEDDTKLQASGAQFSENDNVLVQGVTGSPYAIGYFGYAYYAENTGTLKAISVDGVEPSQENVDNGTYPLARPLFVYSDAAILQEKPQVAAFINFYLSFVNDEVVDVGYFPAPAADLDAARQSWLDAAGQ